MKLKLDIVTLLIVAAAFVVYDQSQRIEEIEENQQKETTND